MKKATAIVIFFIFVAFLLPMVVYFTVNNIKNEKNKGNTNISVYFKETDKTKSVNLEEYLVGVVSAEMPANFEPEALKAQAVAARSYIIYKTNTPNKDHPNASVCTDSTHCKAYKNTASLKQQWGKNWDKYEKKIEKAVKSTRGEILTYDGKCCMTVFHSQAGGGRTENSADVWGGEVAYLVSVESHGEETAPGFRSTLEIPFSEFKEKLNALGAQITNSNDIGNIKKSDGGAVSEITIGKKSFKGTTLRSVFGLRSACFTINADDEKVIFNVTGYGHGVGMSQYGANKMAKEGKNYHEILAHYYKNTEPGYV